MTENAFDDLPTFSIVIETSTQATSDLDHLEQALRSLNRQTVQLERANEIVVIDTGITPFGEVERVCSKFDKILVHRFDRITDYFDAKNSALPFVTGEVVLFADSDCEYEPWWLYHLLEPFKSPDIQIVTGETWHQIVNFYDLGVAVAWVLWPFSYEDRLVPTRNYWANTIAFRREVVRKFPFRNSGRTQRGGQSQHVHDLYQKGHTIWRQPQARAYHPIPGIGQIFRKMLFTGRDTAIITRQGINPLGTRGLWGKRINRFWNKLYLLLKQDRRHWLRLPLALPLTAVLALLYAVGYISVKLNPSLYDRALSESQP